MAARDAPAIEPLGRHHDRSGFSCGEPALDEYLRQRASRTYGGGSCRSSSRSGRFGLFDGILIKDNHVAAAGGIRQAIGRAREALGHMMKIEIEVDDLAQLAQALEAGADAVLLDNMSPDRVREAVALVDGRMTTEVSGGRCFHEILYFPPDDAGFQPLCG